MIWIITEIVTVLTKSYAAAVGHYLQSMAWEFKVSGNFRAKKTTNIRTIGIDPVLM
jgi:hypothetical protein